MSLSGRRVFVQEFHSSRVRSYTKDDRGSIEMILCEEEGGTVSRSVRSFLESVFLPAGYPESVSPDYIQYQIWDSLQAFCSSLTHTLATHAVLKGAGVGDGSATPVAATITWLLKDGTGMLGSILFAFLRGSNLDSECKKWRLFADMVNDVSFLIDLTSHHFGAFFLPIQCLSGLMKSLVGVAGGATRAALSQHQARRNNLADVSAKDSSQETLVNLLALSVNLVLLPIVVTNSATVWTMFTIFTFLHIFCNYKAVRSVNIEVFNMSRLTNTVKSFSQDGRVLTPREANRMENVCFFLPDPSFLRLGVSLAHHFHPVTLDSVHLMETIKREQYLVSFNHGKALVSFKRSASSKDIIKSAFHALTLQFNPSFLHTDIDQKFDDFLTQCRSVGWSLDKHLLDCEEFRFECC